MIHYTTLSRLLLILDIDETLVYASETPLEHPHDFEVFGYFVHKRPGLDAFLKSCAAQFTLAIWSSAPDIYVDAVVENIRPQGVDFQFIWGASRATIPRAAADENGMSPYLTGHLRYVKPIRKARKFGWPLQRMLIVDDTPEKCRRNYGNAIYPKPFEGDPGDRELPLLAEYLETLKDCENVRTVEKRFWRSFKD